MTKLNKLTRRRALSTMGAAVATPFLAKMAAAEAEVTLRFHHFLPPQSAPHRFMFVPWAEKIAAESDGRLAIELYPAMQLGGGPPQLFEQARKGIVDISFSLPTYTPGRFPVTEAGALPFMALTAQQSSTALAQLQAEFGADEYRGLKPLAVFTHGRGMLHMREKPIETVEDLKGQRIRVPSRTVGALFEELGAEPLYMPVSELPIGLANGVIDGTVMSQDGVPIFKLNELTKFHTEVSGVRGIYTAPFAICIGERAYEGLPDDLRAVLDANSGLETSQWCGAQMDSFDEFGASIIAEAGNPINVLDAAETSKTRAASEPVIAAYKATLNDAGLDGEAVVARYDALLNATV